MRATAFLFLLASGCADPPTFLYGQDLQKLHFHFSGPDMGVHPDKSLVRDPDNPFALSPPSDRTKWELQSSSTPVAAFFGWATLDAYVPGGESQYYAAMNLQAIYQNGLADQGDLPMVKPLAIRAYQAVLDVFPESRSYDATGTVSFDLATLAYKGIVALGGMVMGGWVLVRNADGNDVAVRP